MTDRNTGKGTFKPSKTSARFHKMKGGLKESLGRTFRAPGMQQSGAQERIKGNAEYQAAIGHGGYAQGTKDRIAGRKDQVLGSITGDHAQQTRGEQRVAQGIAQQHLNRSS